MATRDYAADELVQDIRETIYVGVATMQPWTPELSLDPNIKLNRNSLQAWAAHNGLAIVGAESHKEMLAELEALRMEVLKLRGQKPKADRISDDVWRRVMRYG